jgi:hypothetical protein
MRKLLIGPALTGIGWLAGSYYGARAEQVVHKSPDEVYAALSQLVDGSKDRFASINRNGGQPVATHLALGESDPGKSMSIQLLLDGKPGAVADVTLAPEQGGQATLVSVKLHGDHAVLRDKLAGSSQARLAYAPDWMLNLTFRPVLRALGEDIEKGQGFASISGGGESEADWEAKLSPDQQRQMQEWRQYDASRPTTDPNADAQNYISSGAN